MQVRLRPRRGGRGRRAPLDRRADPRGPTRRRLRAHRRADRSAHRRPGEGGLRRPRRSTGRAAHGSTPWLGDNAILKAHDVFRRIETLPFSRESRDLFDRPSINIARIEGGDAFNKVPDRCWMDVDIRFLPTRTPARSSRRSGRSRTRDRQVLHARARGRVAQEPVRARAARGGRPLQRGRGAEHRPRRRQRRDLVPEAGIPAVEFGPVGGGHHGPEEWVSIASLRASARRWRTSSRGCPPGWSAAPRPTARGRGRPRLNTAGGRPRARAALLRRVRRRCLLIVLLTAGGDGDRGLLHIKEGIKPPKDAPCRSTRGHRASRASRRRS